MGKGSSVPSPDPQIGQAAIKEAQTGEDTLDFMKSAYADYSARQAKTDDLSNQVSQQALDTSKQEAGWATEDRNRYENTTIPLQDQYISKAQNWDTASAEDTAADKAGAAVIAQGNQATNAQQRQMSAMGVNPSSGRFTGITRASDLATGLAAAGAETAARNETKNEGMAYLGQAANMASGLATQALNSGNSSASTGTTALNNNLAASQAYLAGTGLMTSGASSAMQGYNGEVSGLNTLYGDQANAWAQKEQASNDMISNIGSMVGAVGGIASMI